MTALPRKQVLCCTRTPPPALLLTPSLQARKWGLREAKQLARGHPTRKRQTQDPEADTPSVAPSSLACL